MIVLNLSCHNGHVFEGWFASREAFDGQCARGLVQCAECTSEQVTALPSGPRVLRHAGDTPAHAKASALAHTSAPVSGTGHLPNQPSAQFPTPLTPDAALKLYQALAVMARGAENVGERFPEEARKIHYDEAPARTIRGIASPDETQELLDEGILVLPAPVPSDGEMH